MALIKKGQVHAWNDTEKTWVPSSSLLYVINADDRGAVGDSTTDDRVALQSTIDELAALGGGRLMLTPGKTYATKFLEMKTSVTFDLNRATLKVLLNAGGQNSLFSIGANTPMQYLGTGLYLNTSLSSGTQGATSLTVGSTTGFAAGDRVIVSAGNGPGMGVEEGPIEFNTVASITDGTHLVVIKPLHYSYSAFGLSGSPKLYKVPATQPKNVRITNGRIICDPAFNSILFNINSVEDVEIDHVLFDGLSSGATLSTGGYYSGLNLHHCVGRGTGGGTLWNTAAMCYSQIAFNDFQFATDNITNLEVTCHDNLIAFNTIGPVRGTTVAAIEFNKGDFNNRIIGNRIWGRSADVTAGVGTLGIRSQSTMPNTPRPGFGNVVIGNHISDIMTGIFDRGSSSIIDANTIWNSTSHANSIGLYVGFATAAQMTASLGTNVIQGFTNKVFSDGGVPVVDRPFAVTSMFEGTGSPETVITAAIGSLYYRRDGGAGTTLYVKESGSGNTGWVAYGGAGSFQPLDGTLTALASLMIAANSLSIGTGADAFSQTSFAANTFPARASSGNLVAKAITDFGLSLLDDADASAGRTTLGLGTVATLASDTDGTLAANSDTSVATQKAVKTYIDLAVTGLLDFKGSTNASANPNYPAASKGDAYVVSAAGKIGGASGKSVDIGDVYVASADNAGGTEASVGTSWFVLEHNLVGALLSANNLSDLASASTARTNLGLGALATESATTGSGNVVRAGSPTLTGTLNAATATHSGNVNITGTNSLRLYGVGNPGDANTEYVDFFHNGASGASLRIDKTGTATNRNFNVVLSGTTVMTLTAGGGVQVGAPTGGDKGAGAINAVTVWRNGTSLDSVFDAGYELMSIDAMGEFVKANRHLPTIPTDEVNQNGSTNLGALEDRLWETSENHALYILQLNNRIKLLESKIAKLEKKKPAKKK